MKPCPRCRRTTCWLRFATDFARSHGWPQDLWRFLQALQNECEQVARELRAAVREARAS